MPLVEDEPFQDSILPESIEHVSESFVELFQIGPVKNFSHRSVAGDVLY